LKVVYKNLKVNLTDPHTNRRYSPGHNDSGGKFFESVDQTPREEGEIIVECHVDSDEYYRDGNVFAREFHLERPVAYCFGGSLLRVDTELLTTTQPI